MRSPPPHSPVSTQGCLCQHQAPFWQASGRGAGTTLALEQPSSQTCYSRPRRRDTVCRGPPSSPWQLYVPTRAKLALGSTRDPCWMAEPSGSAVAPARLHCTGELRSRDQAGCVRGQGCPGPPHKPSHWIDALMCMEKTYPVWTPGHNRVTSVPNCPYCTPGGTHPQMGVNTPCYPT